MTQGKLKLRTVVFLYFSGLFSAALLSLIAGMAAIPEDIAVFINYGATQLGFLVPTVIFWRVSRAKFTEIMPLSQPKVKAFLLAPVVAVAAFMQNLLLQQGVGELWSMAGVSAGTSIPDLGVPLNSVLAIIFVAVLPAFSEEFLFRGIFCNSNYKSAYFMLIYSSVVFAIGHLSPVQAVHQFILGMILMYLVYATGTLWYSVAIHFMNNILALYLPYIPGYAELLNFAGTGAWALPLMTVIGAAALYPALYALVGFHRGRLTPKAGILHTLFKKGEEGWYVLRKKAGAIPESFAEGVEGGAPHSSDVADRAGEVKAENTPSAEKPPAEQYSAEKPFPEKAGTVFPPEETFREKAFAIALIVVLVAASVLNVILEAAE